MQRTVLTLVILFITLSLYSQNFWTEKSPEASVEWIRSVMSNMTAEEKLGQMFLLSYEGASPTPFILEWIKERSLGGVKIFGWNANDLSKLTKSIKEMQEASQGTNKQIPLFVATDQEGGWVRHIRGTTSITPGNMAIGATGIPQDALLTGYYIGMELRALGINMNFAPTVDVYTNPQAHVIGPRSFGEDPFHTGILGVAYYRGQEKAGVIATAKHFPGHGHADKDSHGALPMIPRTLKELNEIDLIPYKMLIKEDIPAIMSGHLGFPKITNPVEPASLSGTFGKTLLRDQLQFSNLLITDDLSMHGAQATGKRFPQIAIDAINAGNDILLISRPEKIHQSIWNRVVYEYKNNPEFAKSVNESVERILRIKARYLKREDAVPISPDPSAITELVPNSEGAAFFSDLARRSITKIGSAPWPFSLDMKETLYISQYTLFLNEVQARMPRAKTYQFSYTPFYSFKDNELETITALIEKADNVVFVLATPGSFELLKKLETYKEKLIIISVMTPVYLKELPWIDKAIALYGTGKDSFKAGLDALEGKLVPKGILPIQD